MPDFMYMNFNQNPDFIGFTSGSTHKLQKMSKPIDVVTINIQKMLDIVSSSLLSNPKIFKLDENLRQVNDKAYDPEKVAIGPIHHHKENLKRMEQHKVIYLQQLLTRKNKKSFEEYVTKLRKMEEAARQYYTKSIQLDSDGFVEMLLLDGLFVIEIIRKYFFEDLRHKNDYIFQSDQILSQIRHDMLLFENQIPFFILNTLFDMTKMEDPDDNLHSLILFFVSDIVPLVDPSKLDPRFPFYKLDHLLQLVHETYYTSESFESKKCQPEGDSNDIYSVSELNEAGIRLKKATGTTLMDISFNKGVIELPELIISDKTETVLRNLIAYEQFLSDDHPKYVTDYAFFMHCLINSKKDVEILRRSGIISNWLGDDKMVYLLFKQLGKNIIRPSDFCYSEIFESVNRHCHHLHKKWIPKLRQNYFSSPWASISIVMLLLLTLTQTVFSVLSYTSRGPK